VFLNERTKEAIVAFRGTATNEWTDDFLGANQIDTLQQINCLEWYKLVYNKLHLEKYHVTVIGHSKGGNKAKYITILNNTIDRCVAFDGQGFSDKFVEHYKKEITEREKYIENHNIDYDFVNILMNDIGTKYYYHGYNYGAGGFAESHCPNTFFDFTEPGVYEMRINPNGQAKEMQVLSQFINSMIRSAYNDEDRSKNNKLVGTLVEKAFSIGAKEVSPEEFINILCDMVGDSQYSDNASYLLAYVIKYAKENKKFLEALKGIMTYFNAESFCKVIDMIDDLINSKKLGAILGISNFLIVHVNKIVVNKIHSIIKKKYDIDLTKEQIQKVLQVISMVRATLKTLEINFDGSDLTVEKIENDDDKKLLENLNIVVLAGGLSVERNVSLNTGYMVANELKNDGHNVILLDSYMGYSDKELNIEDAFSEPDKYSLVIDSIQDETPDLWAVKKRRVDQSENYFGPNVIQICKQADLVFIALHGTNGENGKVQAMLELIGIDYTGPDSFSSSLATNKKVAKNILTNNNILVAKSYNVKKNDVIKEPMDYGFTYPVIIKPNNGGISIGISLASDKNALTKALNNAFKWDNEAIVEEYIIGREFAVGMLDGKVLPVLEILPLLTKDHKIGMNLDGIKAKRCPAGINDELRDKLQELAIKASNALGLECYSITSFILSNDNEIYCIGCESLPELNPHSYLAFMANEAGINYKNFCHKIIEMTIND
ncbi:MAG: DUF2974 domain-containing protein, partial [Acholeplasmatales bacterium]|nr:DUF2974 domain-containing protein [Acholeplasmatales bacterium]